MNTINASGEQLSIWTLATENRKSLSTRKVLKFSTELNNFHAPISRIKSFEHLLPLTLSLSVLWCAVTVNDFLKISIFHIWFTCLKCLVEHTQVCKNSRHCQRESKVFGQSLEIFISKLRLIKRKQTRYQHIAFQFLLVYISGLCSHPFQRESLPAKTITLPPTRAQTFHWVPRLSLTIKPIRSFLWINAS